MAYNPNLALAQYGMNMPGPRGGPSRPKIR
jgi:hypothetical protein